MEPGVFMVRWNGRLSSLPGTSLVARNVTPTVCSPAFTGIRWRGFAVAGGVGDFLVPIEQLHALAIDGDFELLALDAAEDGLEVTGDAFDLEGIFAVGGELILDQDAAASSERQPFNVIVLRGVGGHFEDGLRGCRHIADRQAADLSGSR